MGDLAHRNLVLDTVPSATASDNLEAVVDVDNEDQRPGVADYPRVVRVRRILLAVPAEGKGHDHHVEVALARYSSDVGMPYVRGQRLAPGMILV